MKILSLLKSRKRILEQKRNQEEEKTKIDNIEIIIENDCNLFENEKEIIIENALLLLENGVVKTIEEGVIIFAVMFRGLRHKKVDKDEYGKTIITLLDESNKKTLKK